MRRFTRRGLIASKLSENEMDIYKGDVASTLERYGFKVIIHDTSIEIYAPDHTFCGEFDDEDYAIYDSSESAAARLIEADLPEAINIQLESVYGLVEARDILDALNNEHLNLKNRELRRRHYNQ